MDHQQFKDLKKIIDNISHTKKNSSRAFKKTASSITEEDSGQHSCSDDDTYDSFAIMGSISEGVHVQVVPRVEMSPKIQQLQPIPQSKIQDPHLKSLSQDSSEADYVGKLSDLDRSSESSVQALEDNDRTNRAL